MQRNEVKSKNSKDGQKGYNSQGWNSGNNYQIIYKKNNQQECNRNNYQGTARHDRQIAYHGRQGWQNNQEKYNQQECNQSQKSFSLDGWKNTNRNQRTRVAQLALEEEERKNPHGYKQSQQSCSQNGGNDSQAALIGRWIDWKKSTENAQVASGAKFNSAESPFGRGVTKKSYPS